MSKTPQIKPLRRRAKVVASMMRTTLHTLTSAPAWGDASHPLTPSRRQYHAREVRIPIDGGVTPGVLFLPPNITPAPCVLMAHGTAAASLSPYFAQIQALLQHGVGVLFVELDGHGQHPRPLTATGLAQTTTAALDWLAAQEEVHPHQLGVVGVSLGGSCVLRAAAQTNHVQAMALIATPVELVLSWPTRIREFMSSLNPESLEGSRHAPPQLTLRTLRSSIHINHNNTVYHVDVFDERMTPLINHAIAQLDPLEAAAQIAKTPVLFLNGGWDRIAPPSQSELIKAHFHGPHEHIIVPRRNHFTLMTSQNGAQAVGKWFARWLPA